MDMITLSLAVRKVLKELGVEVEKPKTVNFDGNIAGKETFSGEIMGLPGVYVKILNVAITAEEFQGISNTVIIDEEKMSEEVHKSELTARQDGIFMDVTISSMSDKPVVMSIAEDTPVDDTDITITAGTYVLYDDKSFVGEFPGYVSSITYGTETIHPIDPKYLPGVCLPVVELETVIENGAVLSESDSAKLLDAFEIDTPVVIVFTMGDYRNTAVFNCFTTPDNTVKALSTATFTGQVGLLSQESSAFTVVVQ